MVANTTTKGDSTPMSSKKCRSCWLSKQDFFPGDSFQSWQTYTKALSNTKERLKDRFLARSLDHLETHNLLARSDNTMKKTLNWWDLTWFGVGAVMGAGIFVLTGEVARHVAGPAVVLAYFLAGSAAMLSALCYTEFAVEIPVAGGAFAYLRVELGDIVGYIAASNILFEYIVACSSVARSWTSYFATLCGHHPDDFRITVPYLAEGFNRLDPVAVAMLIAVCFGASLSVKGSSRFNMVMTALHVAVLIFIFSAGFSRADPSNFSPFAPFGIHGVVKASAMLFFAYIGFDGVFTLSEEVKNPSRDIPIGIIASMTITIIVYCLLAATVCLMQSYTRMDPNAPFALAFEAVGLGWAKYIVALGALKGMTTVLLASLTAQARYFTHIGRTHMAPPFLAKINGKTGTPVNATITMTLVNSIVTLFTSIEVLAKLLSIATMFIFALVAMALIVRRYYMANETTSSERSKLIVFIALIVCSSISLAIYHALTVDGWIGYAVTVGAWFIATIGLRLGMKEARTPKVWGVPLMPWLPSACFTINVFVLSSLDRRTYVRFAMWTAFMAVYYIFVALHASYDAAKEAERTATVNANRVEEGIAELQPSPA